MANVRSITPFLAARDIAATVEFYTRHFGLKIDLLHPADKPTLAILHTVHEASGVTTAQLIFDSSLWPGPPALTGQILLDLGPQGDGPSRVLPLVAAIRAHAEVLWGPEVYGYGRRECSVRDPNGYALVLSERTDDPQTCPG